MNPRRHRNRTDGPGHCGPRATASPFREHQFRSAGRGHLVAPHRVFLPHGRCGSVRDSKPCQRRRQLSPKPAMAAGLPAAWAMNTVACRRQKMSGTPIASTAKVVVSTVRSPFHLRDRPGRAAPPVPDSIGDLHPGNLDRLLASMHGLARRRRQPFLHEVDQQIGREAMRRFASVQPSELPASISSARCRSALIAMAGASTAQPCRLLPPDVAEGDWGPGPGWDRGRVVMPVRIPWLLPTKAAAVADMVIGVQPGAGFR